MRHIAIVEDEMCYVQQLRQYIERFSRALGRMKKKEHYYITTAVKGGSMKVEASQIFYVESQGHNLIFHTCTGIVKGRGVLKEIEQILVEHGFFRCNNGYLVNLEYVDGVRDGNVIVNGEELLISRPRKAEFLEALAKYMAGGNYR